MPVATESKESVLGLGHETIQAKVSAMDMELDSELQQKQQEDTNGLDLSMMSSKTAPLEDKKVEEDSRLNAPANPNQSTVIIFDWDDTLLASSFLHTRGYRLDTNMPPCEEVDSNLKLLETSVINVLTLALKYGEVNIITNAETGWVQLSAQKFLPGVVPLLSKVTVISARSTYEAQHPDAPLKWKFHAFQDRLSPLFAEAKSNKHVISFGDSHVEREAVRAVTRGVMNTRTKSVKFAERPSMEQLRRQVELVTSCFQYIYTHDGDLDLMLTISLMY
jgi:hypothetical protein